MATNYIGAPGSVARYLQECANIGRTFPAAHGVFGYAPGGTIVTWGTFKTPEEAHAEQLRRPGSVYVDVTSYDCKVAE